jgi:hypothetical protein
LLASGAALAASPWLWIKRSYAQSTPGFGTAKRALILYAAGGLRSAPLFNADAAFAHNPFGQAPSAAEWGVGSVLGTQRLPLFTFPGVELPAVADIAQDIAVIAGIDHEPGTDRAAIDHGQGDFGVATGDMMGEADAGLLTRIHRDHPSFRGGSAKLPPIDVGGSSMGRGERDFAGYRPIAVQSASSFRGRTGGDGRETSGWARDLRLARDERFIAKRSPHVRPYLAAIQDAKINAREYAAALRNNALDLVEVPDAELGGVTNQQLLEVLGGGPFGGQWGLETAFALRMMQLGVPAASVMRYLYDTHSDEKTTLPIDGGDLGRQIAGLHFLMKRMRDSDGELLWDRTIVIVMSEFSRDNVNPDTGFNTGNGSDHQGAPASRNQIWPIFGGPIAKKGKRIGRLDPETLSPVGSGRIYSIRSVHATLLAALGIDSTIHFSDAPIVELFT